MATLQIKKKSLNTWEHIDSELGTFILSKFYFSADGTKFQVVEQGQAKRRIYDITEISVFDIGGSAETFATITALSLRLEELKYPAYNLGGVFSFDPSNYDLDDFNNNSLDPYVRESEIPVSGVITTEYTLLSSSLATQDVSGITTYINSRNPALVIEDNETAYFRVTDTGQIFELKLHGVTVGIAQTPILSSDVLDFGQDTPIITKNIQTGTSYTLLSSDNGKKIITTNSSAITITIPTSLPSGFNCEVYQSGTGQITFVASGTTLVMSSFEVATTQERRALVGIDNTDVANEYHLYGMLTAI